MKHLGLDPFTFFLLLLSSLAWRRETRGFWRQMREGRKSPLWPRGQNLSRDHHQFATRCRSHGVIWLSSYSAPLPGAPLFELCTDLLPQATGRSQEGMLSGHAVTLSQRGASGARLIEDVASEAGDEEADSTARVLYRASFQELMPNYLQYDTIIWAMISLLLVMAWGIGLLLLLYLPYKRYVLKRDILSRQLYVTENYIVYKATRPSYLPFMGIVKKEIKVPLHLIVDVIIEQGCLQSAYSLYTFRIESIAHGKPAPVDELQFHGVHNPDLLRKIIIREASRRTQEVQSWKSRLYSGEGPSYVPPSSGFYSPSAKVKASSIHATLDSKGKIPDSVLLHKLEGVSQSVKNLESLLTLTGSLHTRQ